MEYLQLTLVPRSDGWYGTLERKDTTKVRGGRPASVASWSFEFEGTAQATAGAVGAAMREALTQLAGEPVTTRPAHRGIPQDPLF